MLSLANWASIGMSYNVEFSDAAIEELAQIDAAIQRRILKKVRWLGENFESVTPLALSADLSGLFKLRVGDYRIIYSFDDEIAIISVEKIGHRRDVYE